MKIMRLSEKYFVRERRQAGIGPDSDVRYRPIRPSPLHKPITGCADRNNRSPVVLGDQLVRFPPKDTIMEATSGASSTSAHCDCIYDRWPG